MSATYSEQETLLDGEIQIFILATSKNDIWQVRFRNPLSNKPRYIRKTTGHKSKSLAIARAMELFQEYQVRSHLNLTRGAVTITELYNEYKGTLSKVNRAMARQYYNAYWHRYFGETDMSRVSTSDIEEYFRWRIQDHLNRNGEWDNPRHWVSSGTSVSYYNLKSEKNVMAYLFRQGYGAQLIPRMPNFPERMNQWDNVHILPANARRGRFSEEQYKVLTAAFRDIRRNLLKPEWTPVLQNPDEPFDPETNKWITIAKRDGHIGRDTRCPTYTSKKSRYPKAVFWFASLLMANSGIRVSEMCKLRHKDIKLVKDDEGMWFTVIHVDETVSKLRKTREAITADGAATYQRYLIYKQELEYYFNRNIEETDYLFPQPNGEKYYVGKREKMHNRFGRELEALGLKYQEVLTANGETVRVYCSAYSFRSWYITQRLKNQLDPYTISKNCGVSLKTLLSTYDVNVTWTFRNQMIQHVSRTRTTQPTEEEIQDLEQYAVHW